MAARNAGDGVPYEGVFVKGAASRPCFKMGESYGFEEIIWRLCGAVSKGTAAVCVFRASGHGGAHAAFTLSEKAALFGPGNTRRPPRFRTSLGCARNFICRCFALSPQKAAGMRRLKKNFPRARRRPISDSGGRMRAAAEERGMSGDLFIRYDGRGIDRGSKECVFAGD